MSHIVFKNVKKEYQISGEIKVTAAQDINFEIENGEFVIILGSSGAGKTTLLNLIGGMEEATSGEIIVDNKQISGLNTNKLTQYRRESVGFVFQFYNLIPDLTALENIELATHISENPFDAMEILKSVGLERRSLNFPSQLSGGEQQRISIARAIAKNPRILLCDEPTGALDSETGKSILKLLHQISKENNKTTIVVTHNPEFAKIADRIIKMRNGKIEEVTLQENPLKVENLIW
ncbi:ABC transporter ATP-binding protein [Macrococcus animalis]|uniref:ABC transporter ATP-binding protein n=1 Tax=Macrococcus animalis TaxID=3395467 RepID=UPI0039BDA4D7